MILPMSYVLNVMKKVVEFLLTIFFCDVPDIDECETGTHNCPPDFICQNTPGSFRCRPKLQCMSGFIQDALGNCIGKICSYLGEYSSVAWEISGSFTGWVLSFSSQSSSVNGLFFPWSHRQE